MKTSLPLLSVTLLALTAGAQAMPLDATGTCPGTKSKASLTLATPGEAGGLTFMPLAARQAFVTAHAANTLGDYDWLLKLSGGGKPRIFREGREVVYVLSACDARDCNRLRSYVAFEPKTSSWGATVLEGGSVRELVQDANGSTLAMHKQVLSDALVCAVNTDQDAK